MHTIMICPDCYDMFTLSAMRKLCGECRLDLIKVTVDNETMHHIWHHRIQKQGFKSDHHPCTVYTCIGIQCNQLNAVLQNSKEHQEA